MFKYKNAIFLTIFGILFLNRCATYNNVLPENSIKVNDYKDLKGFEGVYSDLPESYISSNPNLLWGKLKLRSKYSEDWKFSNVRLIYQDNKKIIAQLIKDDVIIDQQILRGKIKNNCYYIKGTFYILPIFPLYFGYYNDRRRLILSDHETLILENTWNYWVFFTFGGEESKDKNMLEYKKIK